MVMRDSHRSSSALLILPGAVAKLVRTAAWATVVAGVAAPMVRRRLRMPAPVTIAAAYAAPLAASTLWPQSRRRDIALCLLQMHAYVAAYKMPADDLATFEKRVHVGYPIVVDRAIGFGRLPTQRLQQAFATPGVVAPHERVLVWAHWVWFFVPHGTVVWMLYRHPERGTRTALMTYAMFNAGCLVYWAVPTAPPWFAAQQGRIPGDGPAVRRMMLEEGERFWGANWTRLYGAFGGNPHAAMPSLHFGTSFMAARLLADADPVEGAVAFTYALTLGLALVYLGEHYVIDLLAGAALAEVVRAASTPATPALGWAGRRLATIRRRARP